ncbi:hypothetical protein [Natronobeatus ordinarius]|uniref:hypothetical protein n=1 Tax=Natronobeatus ordinarius TaxID=2963433 RepID=UPI0020CF51AA|nr:hypothetical protein [Natronobeatus ordinarius]
MGRRTDAALTLLALGAFVVAFLAVDATLSAPFLALGGAGTIAFELLAARDPAAVREYWDRRPVQLASLALAVALAGLGALIAPSSVLSAGIGTLVTYLLYLALVWLGALDPAGG